MRRVVISAGGVPNRLGRVLGKSTRVGATGATDSRLRSPESAASLNRPAAHATGGASSEDDSSTCTRLDDFGPCIWRAAGVTPKKSVRSHVGNGAENGS